MSADVGAGDVVWAVPPAAGQALPWSAKHRTAANIIAFMELAETWINPTVERDTASHLLIFAQGATLAHSRSPMQLGSRRRGFG